MFEQERLKKVICQHEEEIGRLPSKLVHSRSALLM